MLSVTQNENFAAHATGARVAEIAESKSPECLQCHQVLGSGASTPNRPFSGPKLYQKEKCKPLFCQSLNFQAGYYTKIYYADLKINRNAF